MRFLIVSVCEDHKNQHKIWKTFRTRSAAEKAVRKMNVEAKKSNPGCSSLYCATFSDREIEAAGSFVWGDELRSRGYFF